MTMSRTLAAKLVAAIAFVTFAVTLGVAQPAAALDSLGAFDDFHVQYDQVELMRLDDDATDVIVGNPSIADVAIQSGRLLMITGKTFGVTNLIVLNKSGQIVTNRRLVVRADDLKTVNLNRGTLRESYNCAPQCQSVLKIGDESTYYTRIAKAAEDKFKVFESAGDGGGGN